MAEKSPDRRVLRSRRALQEALVALTLERGYAEVTVQAILDRADLGRATFYAHFASKEALLLSLFEELRASLDHELRGVTPATIARFGEGVGLLTPLFRHAAENRRLYQTLLASREGGALLQHLREMLTRPLRAHLLDATAAHGQAMQGGVELVVTAFVSAVLGVLVWWLESGLPGTPEELDRSMERLMAGGIGVALHLQNPGEPHPTPVEALARAAALATPGGRAHA